MKILLAGLCGLLVAELLLRVPLVKSVRDVTQVMQKAIRTLASKEISDHWKERVLPAYALRMGLGSVMAFGWLLIVFLPFLLLGLIWPDGGLAGLSAFLLDWRAILGLTVLCIGYVWLRGGRRRAEQTAARGSDAYSPADRLLHQLVLGAPVLPEMIHDIERALYLKSAPDITGGRHVFVTGLARAGTTVLLRELYRTAQFGTLTYGDMPFVLAPNLWARLSRRKDPGALRERAHGDGIAVNAESPEAFDEVFWRVHEGDAYIRRDRLLPHWPDAEALAGYGDLMALVLRRRGKARYLSKNNNNILRLEALSAAFPDAVILVPLRDPLQHADSLLRQHRRFAGADRFTADYMRWLGHHEFGRTHRPFAFGDRPQGDPATPDYWLRLWIAVYRHIAGLALPNLVIVAPDHLSADVTAQAGLAARLDLPTLDLAEMRPVTPREVPECDPALVADAYEIFRALHPATGPGHAVGGGRT